MPLASGMSITWKLVRNANFQAHHRHTELETPESQEEGIPWDKEDKEGNIFVFNKSSCDSDAM